jgi:hypothetical protein
MFDSEVRRQRTEDVSEDRRQRTDDRYRYPSSVFRLLSSNIFTLCLLSSVFCLLFHCAENKNPLIKDREYDNVPVQALKFIPKRKFVSNNNTVPLLVESYNPGYICSQINHFEIRNTGDTLWPDISAELPHAIDDCPMVGEKGLDSVLHFSFEDWSGLPKDVFLRNSGDEITDQALLVSLAHRRDSLEIGIDSALARDTSMSSLELIPELEMPCEDSLSYAYFCLSAERDTLFLWRNVVSEWNNAACESSVYPYVPEPEFFHEIQRDSVTGCQLE